MHLLTILDIVPMYSKVTMVDGWQYCLVCFSSGKSFYRTHHMHINLSFHPAGKLLKAEGKQLKMAPGSSWNQADSLGSSLPRVNNKDSWETFSDNLSCKDCESRPPAWIKRKLAELHGRGLDQTETLGRDTLQRIELPAGCAMPSRLPDFVSQHHYWGGLCWCSCLGDVCSCD